ncbi:MAG: D-2-hydroxyacid dehydrogenase family protein [Chloroflexota bacterium]|nr:D-2-hydroxyacid dehydrogenase family protein [Chloroflexota bacterium]MDE2968543.1 D-2-hydroxyacid dehydrogenase family protein [Chloroflexota bacterium]
MVRVAVIDDYQNVASTLADWDSLPEGSQVDFYQDHLTDTDALVERLRDYDIIQLMRERTEFKAEILDALPNLRMLSGTGGAYQNSIDIPHATELGIVLTRTGGSAGGSVEELTWALILGLSKRLREEDHETREGLWQTSLSPTLSGRTLGIIGLGRLGKRVAQIGQAFNMRLVAWSPWQTAERAAESGAELLSREEFFSTSYVISIHIPLSAESRGLVTADDLAMMQPNAFLINTSRGPIVDEVALVAALRAGTIGGAGLDVFDEEPLPKNHPFLSLPNTLLTPHIGFVTEEGYQSFYKSALANIKAFLAGEPTNVINPEALEKR